MNGSSSELVQSVADCCQATGSLGGRKGPEVYASQKWIP